MINDYAVCTECETGINNDDWSSLDNYNLTEEEYSEELARRTSSVEAMGNVERADEEWQTLSGAYNCWVCSEVVMNPALYNEII